MQLARILGTATATVRHESLRGSKLVIAQLLMTDGQRSDGDPVLAVDQLGAGVGDVVILTTDGTAARAMLKNQQTPVRYSVMGLKDS